MFHQVKGLDSGTVAGAGMNAAATIFINSKKKNMYLQQLFTIS